MIEIKVFAFNDFVVNSFVLSDESKECVIIDSTCYSEKERVIFEKYITNNSLNPVKLLTTHGHIDHILGNNFAKEKFQMPIFMNNEDEFLVEGAVDYGQLFGFSINKPPLPDENIEDNQIIKFGNSELKALHVPGHSPGSIAFYNEKQKFAIVGDVLFHGSIGRTDLPGGNYDTIINSIKSKLLVLPDETIIYPGHGEATSIGNEKEYNAFLK